MRHPVLSLAVIAVALLGLACQAPAPGNWPPARGADAEAEAEPRDDSAHGIQSMDTPVIQQYDAAGANAGGRGDKIFKAVAVVRQFALPVDVGLANVHRVVIANAERHDGAR